MQSVFILLIICSLGFDAMAQSSAPKTILDTNALNNWTIISTPALGNDGKHLGYLKTKHYEYTGTLNLVSLGNQKTKVFENVSAFNFSNDNHYVFFLRDASILMRYDLRSGSSEEIQAITDYQVIRYFGQEYILCTDTAKHLKLMTLDFETKISLDNVASWQVSNNAKTIVIIRQSQSGQILYNIDSQLKPALIGEFKKITDMVFDRYGNQLAFVGKAADSIHSIFVYDVLKEKMDTLSTDILKLESIQGFSGNGKYLLVNSKRDVVTNKTKSDFVRIWNYSDRLLQSQLAKSDVKNVFLDAIDLRTGQLIPIETARLSLNVFSDLGDNLNLIERVGDDAEYHWNNRSIPKRFIVDSSLNIKSELQFDPYWMSPDKAYIVGQDALLKYFFVFETSTARTFQINFPNQVRTDSLGYVQESPKIFAGWNNEHSILFYDTYDIFEIDLTAPGQIMNLTNGFGRRNNITFRFAIKPGTDGRLRESMKYLYAFDHVNKRSGYYRLSEKTSSNPRELSMSDMLFYSPGDMSLPDFNVIKARDADVWIVKAEQAHRSPNLFLTKNFKDFEKVSDVHPEDKYNWLTTELVKYTLPDGKACQAVLFKPENFDSTKKYPLIINVYEQFSDLLHRFQEPKLSEDRMNIPWFVSRGYIICTPDIFYKWGQPGQSALKSVTALLDTLTQIPFIDSTRMAIQGHSYGGYETQYIISHTNRFKAAMSASGLGNITADYNQLLPMGNSKQGYFENSQFHMGKTLWEGQQDYILSSPIYNADKINTPLLMMNGDQDAAVPFSQGIEFFTAMRRLGKQVWMLQYIGGTHSLLDKNMALDYTERLEEFFGHYLMGTPMPDWIKPKEQ